MTKSADSRVRECRTCPVRSTSVVCHGAELDPQAFQRLVLRFHLEPRQVLFYEGHPCLGVYVLCAGKAKLSASTPTGHRRIVGIIGPGELIECTGFCDGAIHEVTCEALEISDVCLISRQGYLELLERSPSLAVELLQLVSGAIHPERNGVERYPACKAAGRLAAHLLDIGRRFGQRGPDGITLEIRLSREELAELVGTAPETVIRLLSRFRRERLVATKGSEITILKPDRLGKLANTQAP